MDTGRQPDHQGRNRLREGKRQGCGTQNQPPGENGPGENQIKAAQSMARRLDRNNQEEYRNGADAPGNTRNQPADSNQGRNDQTAIQ